MLLFIFVNKKLCIFVINNFNVIFTHGQVRESMLS